MRLGVFEFLDRQLSSLASEIFLVTQEPVRLSLEHMVLIQSSEFLSPLVVLSWISQDELQSLPLVQLLASGQVPW